MFGRNNQPSDNGCSKPQTSEEALHNELHWALKHEQKVWGSGEHEAARAEVDRIVQEISNINNLETK